MKNKNIVIFMIISLLVTWVACTKDNYEDSNLVKETNRNQQTKDNLDKVTDSVEVNSTSDTKGNESIQEDSTTDIVTKLDGRRQEFLERLDNIQRELDALPEKEDSDAGVTNAMKNYYGKSYDMYDEILNEIYGLLKEELSSETMNDLQIEQIKWIEQKENIANKEAAEYKGKTFEFVAYQISLYESTKERCYGLVNQYMTD